MTARPPVLAPRGADGSPWKFCVVIAALLLGLSTSVVAHRGHAVWTDISWSGDGFEIVHRMHLVDAISINRFAGGSLAIEEMRSLALVALYIEERFTVAGESGSIVLQTIGAEIEDDFLLVYQEWKTALPAAFPQVDNRVLLDVEPQSQAFVYIKGPGISEERQR
ncbi:MAG: hypothetical protein ACI87W_003094 [Halieaceae bacterium]|jgi:hypothetical protein